MYQIEKEFYVMVAVVKFYLICYFMLSSLQFFKFGCALLYLCVVHFMRYDDMDLWMQSMYTI